MRLRFHPLHIPRFTSKASRRATWDLRRETLFGEQSLMIHGIPNDARKIGHWGTSDCRLLLDLPAVTSELTSVVGGTRFELVTPGL